MLRRLRRTCSRYSSAASCVPFLLAACGGGSNAAEHASGTPTDDTGNSFDNAGTNGEARAGDPVSAVGNRCAGTSANLNGLPLHLVLVLDKSGSMDERLGAPAPGQSSPSKWEAAKLALNEFFSSARSAGITLDIIPFPNTSTDWCVESAYNAPIASAILPDTAKKLSGSLSGMTTGGSTPTNPALHGAIAYAKGLQSTFAGKANVALILATDGEPESCPNNTVPEIASHVSSVQESLKTYVIGLGDQLESSLNQIAAAGGTNNGKAFLVTSTSASIANDLGKALSTIRAAALSCSYELPAAPAGQTLDFNQVNVVYGTKDDRAVLVKHSADCSDPSGWRYDDESAPRTILLCDSVCGTVKGDTVQRVDVVLGCATSASVPVN